MPSIKNISPNVSLAKKIVGLIGDYRFRSSHITDQFEQQKQVLQSKLEDYIHQERPIDFILPAFPFKAPIRANGSRSTLSSLPDKSEEIALQTLNVFADSIQEIYQPGATVTIVSDASVYGDLLQIDEMEAFEYGHALREMAKDLGLKHLRFIRPIGLRKNDDTFTNSQQEYFNQNQELRQILETEYSSNQFYENENINATKKHYDNVLTGYNDQNKENVQKAMIKRGKAYAALIAKTSPDSIRLSIHESNNLDKITFDLFPPSTNPNFITPWHGAVAILKDASVVIVDASTMDKDRFEVIKNAKGQPWLLREKSQLFKWSGLKLDFEPLYPCGMVVRPIHNHGPFRFEDVDMKSVRNLALSTAPLLLRGFSMEVKKEIFREKASQLGEIQMWPFGDILEVKENANFNMNNVLTNEAMPYHYDGVFKTETDKETGKVKSVPPLFQMFRNKAASQQIGGLTLFSSSRNMLALLGPESITLENLKKLNWRTFTVANQAFGGQELVLPFISPHPITQKDVFRFHEPWPATKCIAKTSEPTIVEVVELDKTKGESLCERLTQLMYDRRVMYRHQWSEGDFIFNDNATTHHTRTAFEQGHRELWRVHVN
ncbi:hypothetical protein L7F22_037257 [Adiantum nelumboides]|nr:hypothetical protein [Adiantum nelumboides]